METVCTDDVSELTIEVDGSSDGNIDEAATWLAGRSTELVEQAASDRELQATLAGPEVLEALDKTQDVVATARR